MNVSRTSKVDCLIAASQNVMKKSKAKNLDDAERKTLLGQARNLLNEAQRHLDAKIVHGDQMTNRTTKLQAASA